jgi:hypothetical protein
MLFQFLFFFEAAVFSAVVAAFVSACELVGVKVRAGAFEFAVVC